MMQLVSSGFFDADPFFHTKIASFLSHDGSIDKLPWMHFSVLNNQYSDYSFLYHLVLIPFYITLGFFGTKFLSALLLTLFLFIFYQIMLSLKVRYSLAYIVLLITSSGLLYRLNLARPLTIALILAIVGFYLIYKRKIILLGVVSFLFTLSYSASFILIVFAVALLCTQLIQKKKIDYFLCIPIIAGIILGIFVHPNFPNNIYVNNLLFSDVFRWPGVSAEMMPSDFKSLITQNILIWIIFCGLLSILIYYRQELKKLKEKISVEGLTAFLLSIFFFILTIRSQRFIEYWVPFTVLAGAIVARDFKVDVKLIEGFKKIWNTEHQPSNITSSTFQSVKSVKGDTLDRRTNNMDHDQYITRSRIFLAMLAVLLSIIISLSFFKSFYNNYTSLKNADPYDRLKPASEWLIKNTPDKSIVYNVAWDEFPELFFWNTHNYYIVGMDPTFLYEYDKSLYKKYQDIYEGKDKNPSQTIKKYFNSKYIFSGKTNQDFINVAGKDVNLEKAYEDQWSLIYKVAN